MMLSRKFSAKRGFNLVCDANKLDFETMTKRRVMFVQFDGAQS
jgi:hypothetical protein